MSPAVQEARRPRSSPLPPPRLAFGGIERETNDAGGYDFQIALDIFQGGRRVGSARVFDCTAEELATYDAFRRTVLDALGCAYFNRPVETGEITWSEVLASLLPPGVRG